MNEKYQKPTLEQLRAILSGHPELLKHIESEKVLYHADRKKLMELMDLCDLSIDQVDNSDPYGLLRGLKNNPGKDPATDRTDPDGFLQGDEDDPTYGQEANFVTFDLTIEALGHKKHYTAFLEYLAKGNVKKHKLDGDWDLDEFTFDNTIKILSYTDMPEPGYKASRRSIKKASPMDEIRPVILENPTINELFPQKALEEIMDQIEDDLLGQIVSAVNFPEDQAAGPDTD